MRPVVCPRDDSYVIAHKQPVHNHSTTARSATSGCVVYLCLEETEILLAVVELPSFELLFPVGLLTREGATIVGHGNGLSWLSMLKSQTDTDIRRLCPVSRFGSWKKVKRAIDSSFHGPLDGQLREVRLDHGACLTSCSQIGGIPPPTPKIAARCSFICTSSSWSFFRATQARPSPTRLRVGSASSLTHVGFTSNR